VKLADRAERERIHDRHLIEVGAEAAWGWTTAAGRRRAARRAQLIADGARLRPGITALELGCGTGVFTEQFARTGAALCAVDLSADLIAVARRRTAGIAQVDFHCEQFERMHVDVRFDAIIGSSVLHHLDLTRALRRIRQLLKAGGVISFAEPNMLNPQVFLERHARGWFHYVSPDETAFVRWNLARRLRTAGFVDVKITPFDWLHPMTWSSLIGAVEAGGRTLERLPVLREFAGSLLISARSGLQA
jgi:2-polyprenyl-3-methyl-5-hydroxy-6-metoxy-1,4-benzoquinol methylase